MRIDWPTAAAACFFGISFGRFSHPSFSTPRATAPEVRRGPVARFLSLLHALEDELPDDLVRAVKRRPGARERLGEVGRDDPALLDRGERALGLERRGLDHDARHLERAFELRGRLEQRLLVFLHVAI